MKSVEYGNKEIGTKEVAYGVCNMVIGLGILTLPSSIAGSTSSSDGWMSIFLGGIVALVFTWLLARLVSRFPKQDYREITAAITNRVIGNVITLVFVLYMFLFVSYEVRGVSSISKLYLFDTTPVEPICFAFLLVLIYGVAGPSITLLRLNLIFLPIIFLVVLVLLVMSIGDMNYHLLKPMFVTGWTDVLKASKETAFSFLGFEVLLFYNRFINRPEKTVKAAVAGIVIPTALYLLVFVFVIGVFGHIVVANTLYPMAELAKQLEVPGGFFERFESLFFVIWVISLFGTAAMAFDVMLLGLQSVFPALNRMISITVLSPLLFVTAMLPQNIEQIRTFSKWISYLGIGIGWCIPALLLLTAKLRGVKGDA